MQDYEGIDRFLTQCSDLIEGKYVAAEGNIADVLSSIAASAELRRLFTEVVRDFDYPRARRTFLREPQGMETHGSAYVPASRPELLAFVFCLLTDLDAGREQLNLFLLKYFYLDGSLTSAFNLFAERLVRPFRDIVRDCYPDAGRRRAEKKDNSEILNRIAERIPAELERVRSFRLRTEERDAAEVILSGASALLTAGDSASVAAVLAGYRYFLRYIGGEDEGSDKLFDLASKL